MGDSSAVARRVARGMRRNRDRGKNRMDQLIETLLKLDLLPDDEDERARLFGNKKGDGACFNPYRLRAEALERALTPH
ncbi:MAG: hypothetical protein HN360_10795, partial [Rhodospirillaceae bacterium]|nr:hypothetical protein [Rhodospirillaceae bacterium]